MNRIVKTGVMCACFSSLLLAQLNLRGQVTAEFFKSGDGYSEYSINQGRATFAWRADVFADALVSEHVALLGNFRMLQDQIPHVDLLAIRITDLWSSGISVEAGQIDIPFGDLGDERYPAQNPFFSLPLLNEHVTSLCESNYNLWTFSPDYAIRGDGVRLLDRGLYDLGIKAYGQTGMVEYGAALINGMVSSTGTYFPNGLNSKHSLGTVLRLAVTPVTGFKIGVSYAFGPFMKDVSDSIYSLLYEQSPDNYLQRALGGDVEYAIGHFQFKGQILANSWQYVQGVHLDALGYSAMVRYAFTPRISAAVRAGSIVFDDVSIREYIPRDAYNYTGPYGYVQYNGKWDHDVVRLEGAVSYKIERALLLKVGYQANRTYNVSHDPFDDVFFVQTVVSF